MNGSDVESADNFIDAIQIYFASILVFNGSYPEAASATWLFIQESLMKAKTNSGSKCSQHSLKYEKVVSLFTKLREINIS